MGQPERTDPGTGGESDEVPLVPPEAPRGRGRPRGRPREGGDQPETEIGKISIGWVRKHLVSIVERAKDEGVRLDALKQLHATMKGKEDADLEIDQSIINVIEQPMSLGLTGDDEREYARNLLGLTEEEVRALQRKKRER